MCIRDRFRVVSSPKKSYVIKGEKFETEVFLSASAGKSSNTGIKISVNGANLPVDENGAAKYSATANEVGIKKYKAIASVFNPVTKETKSYPADFEYEVGERSVTISATKMNVFYIGVDLSLIHIFRPKRQKIEVLYFNDCKWLQDSC